MTISAEALGEMLAPSRENTVAALLGAQARAIDAGAEIAPEPILRQPDGRIRRTGRLHLPERGDLAITLDGRTLIQRVETPEAPRFTPCEVFANRGFAARVAPLFWDRVVLGISANAEHPNWGPLRRWFLEWFQDRQTDLAPELGGVLHRLDGPRRDAAGWRVTVDLGSAPVQTVAALIAAVGQSGASTLRIGGADEG